MQCKMKQKRSFCLELLHISLMLMGILLSKSKNRNVQQTGYSLALSYLDIHFCFQQGVLHSAV